MRPALWMLLAGAVLASVYVSSQEDEDALVARRPAAAQSARPARAEARTDARTDARLQAAQAAQDAVSQGVQAWQQRTSRADVSGHAPAMQAWAGVRPPPIKVAATQAEAPPPPPPPMAPRFPHKWIGRLTDEAQPAAGQAPQRAIVAGPASTWVLREGDVIEGQWRVDRIAPRTMTLTYLPLQLTQTVALNGS